MDAEERGEREERAIQWGLEESNRRVKEERGQAKESQQGLCFGARTLISTNLF